MAVEITAAIIGGTVAIAGIASGVIQTMLRSRERKEELRQQTLDEYIINALPRFCGGRQERTAGISVIGHYWDDVPRLKGLFVRLLTGQGVYVIAEGNPEKAHEYYNLERIIRLVQTVPKSQSVCDQEINDLICELRRQKPKAAANQKADPDTRVTEAQIDDWINRLTNKALTSRSEERA